MKWLDFWSLCDDSAVFVLCDEEFTSNNSKSILNFEEFISNV